MKSEFAFGVESAAWPALLLDGSGALLHANQAAAKQLGLPVTVKGSSLFALLAPDSNLSLEALLGQVERNPLTTTKLKLRDKAGAISSFQAFACIVPSNENRKLWLLQLFPEAQDARSGSAKPSATPPSGKAPVDKSNPRAEIAALESTVAQKQKLDCALQLTRTVALDFNNALTSILGHTSLILSKMDPTHPWRNSLVEVEKSAEKAAEVAADLAAFSRQEKETRSHVAGNLNDLVRRTAELFQGPGVRQAQWSLLLEPKLYTSSFEEAKMQQAFVKILDNAIQSLGENGRIIIRTRNQDVVEPVRDANVRLEPGHYVCVEFEDNGCGIAPEVLPRIFEPFFTTKKAPHHRGLGLAWVYGIVTNHGGTVAVSSQPARGTGVRVYLPAQRKIVRDRALRNDDLGGSETILMIDDEELLLTMGEMVLSSFGYRVFTASSGQQALEVFSNHQDQIDLVITDLVMPKMSGRELIEQLRRLSPSIKIICSSGYIRALNAEEEETYLQKPFTSVDLLRKVKQVLTQADVS